MRSIVTEGALSPQQKAGAGGFSRAELRLPKSDALRAIRHARGSTGFETSGRVQGASKAHDFPRTPSPVRIILSGIQAAASLGTSAGSTDDLD